jgi:hypothetical protein
MNITPTFETWVEYVKTYSTHEIFKQILSEERDPTWPSINRQLRIRALNEVFAERMKEAGIDWVI